MSKMEIEKTLQERGRVYGDFLTQGKITQSLKSLMRSYRGWEDLHCDQREALDMIASKISRILNGDPNYVDSWHDISGYATLIEKRISNEQ